MKRGNVDNLVNLFGLATDWERADGSTYYERQYHRLWRYAGKHTVKQLAAAFAVLSPNTDETSNYAALEMCILIVDGSVPANMPVRAYPLNKAKALAILTGGKIESILKGNKVYSFYRNTLNPLSDAHVTIDGHMLGAWCNRRYTLRRDAQIHGASEYHDIAEDFRIAARQIRIPATHFQATLWLTWKRLHRIMYTGQTVLELERNEEKVQPLLRFRPSYLPKVGQSTPRDILYTQAEQLNLELDVALVLTGSLLNI